MSTDAYENIKPHINTLQKRIILILGKYYATGLHYRTILGVINNMHKTQYMPMTISARLTELRQLKIVYTVDSLNYLTELGLRLYEVYRDE